MSEIGKINLDLQEQANELGYSTVQEAIDAGYVVLYIKPDTVKPLEENIGRTFCDINFIDIIFDPPFRVMKIKNKLMGTN